MDSLAVTYVAVCGIQDLFPKLLNDRLNSKCVHFLVDCCDGSDEYGSSINCPNTCVMGGNIEYQTKSHVSAIGEVDPIDGKEATNKLNLDDLIEKLKGILFSYMVASFQLKSV